MELVVIAPYTHTHTFICIFKFTQRVYEATIFLDRHYITLKDNFSRMLPGLWKQPSLSSCVSPWLSHHLRAYTTSLLTPPPCSHYLPAHTTPCSLYSHTTSLLTPLPCSYHPLLTLLSHHLLAHFTLTPSLAHFTLTPPPCSHHLCLTPDRPWGGRFPHQAVLCDPSWVSCDLTRFSKHSLTYNQR